MYTLFIMILWTWGLTPEWVNIFGTVLSIIGILYKVLKFFGVITDNDKTRRSSNEWLI